MTTDRITVELSRDEWIALLAAAFYGADVVENEIGGHVAGTAERAIDSIRPALNIPSLIDAAHDYEAQQRAADDNDKSFNPSRITPSA
jgi:hypothetical protein